MLQIFSGSYLEIIACSSSTAINSSGSFLLTSAPSPWRSVSCKPRLILRRVGHCQEALKSDSGIDKFDAMFLALAMERDEGIGRLSQRMLSIQTYSISSSSVNHSAGAATVCSLACSVKREDRGRIPLRFSQTFRTALSLTPYSLAKALLLGADVLLSCEIISQFCDSLTRFPFKFFDMGEKYKIFGSDPSKVRTYRLSTQQCSSFKLRTLAEDYCIDTWGWSHSLGWRTKKNIVLMFVSLSDILPDSTQWSQCMPKHSRD